MKATNVVSISECVVDEELALLIASLVRRSQCLSAWDHATDEELDGLLIRAIHKALSLGMTKQMFKEILHAAYDLGDVPAEAPN